MHTPDSGRTRPWYKQPWVWLLIALPLSAVIGSMVTIYLAVTTSDGLVVDDYYKRGKAINLDLARDQAAARYGLEVSLAFDLRHNRVRGVLTSAAGVQPDTLKLSLLHPTQAGHDQVVMLSRTAADTYSGDVQEMARGNWYLQLEADDWRLSGAMLVPHDTPVVLRPVAIAEP